MQSERALTFSSGLEHELATAGDPDVLQRPGLVVGGHCLDLRDHLPSGHHLAEHYVDPARQATPLRGPPTADTAHSDSSSGALPP